LGKPSLKVTVAGEEDVVALASMRTSVAHELTRLHGKGHWSSEVTEKGVLRALPHARVLVARSRGKIVGTLRLATKKPWAIDRAYFADSTRPLYLTDMAVAPERQRRGIGKALMESAADVARAWPADAIRLDAYDGPAGAGPFYAKCGMREVGRVRYRGVPLVYFELLL
jgi:GNAT superfamily N-acetyltransferase